MPSPGITVALGLFISLVGIRLLSGSLNAFGFCIIVIFSFVLAHFILRFAVRLRRQRNSHNPITPAGSTGRCNTFLIC